MWAIARQESEEKVVDRRGEFLKGLGSALSK
jgi:hypothetical protein